MIKNARFLTFLATISVFSGTIAAAAESIDSVQFGQMVESASEQFALRKATLKTEVRNAAFRALVSAYIGGLFAGDFAPVRLARAFDERDWSFFGRVLAGNAIAFEELFAIGAALHELYQVAATERQFNRMLQDIFAAQDAQGVLQRQLDSEDFSPSEDEKPTDERLYNAGNGSPSPHDSEVSVAE